MGNLHSYKSVECYDIDTPSSGIIAGRVNKMGKFWKLAGIQQGLHLIPQILACHLTCASSSPFPIMSWFSRCIAVEACLPSPCSSQAMQMYSIRTDHMYTMELAAECCTGAWAPGMVAAGLPSRMAALMICLQTCCLCGPSALLSGVCKDNLVCAGAAINCLGCSEHLRLFMSSTC